MSERTVADLIDATLEATVVPSFTRIGPLIRRRIDHWNPIDDHDLVGTTALVTGATSGLGRQVAETLVRLGATVLITGRDERRLRDVVDGASATGRGLGELVPITADMGEFDDVRRLADATSSITSRLHVLVHNAGALSAERTLSSGGIEQTVASQVAGPFLLTTLLLPTLAAAAPGRVLTVTSGGMYTAPLTVDGLQMPAGEYTGSGQYARAKRAGVTLNEMWAARCHPSDIVFHAMHPGWVDTPGIRTALPRFGTLMGPLLRSPADGADTLLWLATDPLATRESGTLWLDRRSRPIHRLGRTRRSDTPERRSRLWQWCEHVTGVSPELSRR